MRFQVVLAIELTEESVEEAALHAQHLRRLLPVPFGCPQGMGQGRVAGDGEVPGHHAVASSSSVARSDGSHSHSIISRTCASMTCSGTSSVRTTRRVQTASRMKTNLRMTPPNSRVSLKNSPPCHFWHGARARAI